MPGDQEVPTDNQGPIDPDFIEESTAFIKGDTARIICDSLAKRDWILHNYDAKVMAANYIAKDPEQKKIILMRETSNPNISIEDHIPDDPNERTQFYIYNKPDDSKKS